MKYFALVVCVCAYFAALSVYAKRKGIQERTEKIVRGLSILTWAAPCIVAVIFTVLFSFGMRGRLMERIPHAILVFSMWICGLQFYKHMVLELRDKKNLGGALIGILLSAGTAIFLTPLDRFCRVLYFPSKGTAVPFSIGVLIFIYSVIWSTDRSLRKHQQHEG